MRGFAVVAALLAAALGGGVAEARVKAGPGVNPGWHKLGAAANSALDRFTTPTAAYGLRKLKSTYAGSAVRLRRASDNAEQDIGFLGFVPGLGAPLDIAAANVFCTATSCFVRTWYDQSGGSLDAVQATAANQPAFVFNCNGFQPCMQATVLAQTLSTASQTPVLPVSLNAVAWRLSTGACFWGRQFAANNVITGSTVNVWLLSSTGSVSGAATGGVWHSASGVIDGASSVFGVDGVETTGTVTGSVTAGIYAPIIGAAGATCNVAEQVLWSGYGLTAGERSVLTNNQRSFWGF